MRRLLMVSAVAALMAAMTALMAAPAMALDLDFNDDDHDLDNNDFRGFDFGGVDFDNENELESGPVDLDFSVTNTGDYASQCVSATQFGNTGNFNNAPTFAQFGSGGFVDDERNDDDFGFFDDERNDHRRNDFFGFFNDGGIDDFEPGGIEFSVAPEVAVDCSNTIQQSSAADSSGYWW